MSTKIFNGYKITASSIDEAIDFILRGKKEVLKQYHLFVMETQTRRATKFLDNFLITEFLIKRSALPEIKLIREDFNASKFSPFSISYRQEMEIVQENEKDDAEIILFPKKIINENESFYMAILFSKQSFLHNDDFTKKITNIYRGKMQEYGYWNNTDKPEDISSKDWNKRRVNWDKVSPTGIPVMDGISIKLILKDSSIFSLSDEQRKIYIENSSQKIDYEKRIKSAKEEIMIEIVSSEKTEDSVSSMMRLVNNVKDKKFTKEQQKIYDTLDIKLRSCLPESVNFELLDRSFEEITNDLKSGILNMELSKKLKEKLINNKNKVKL